MYAKKEKIYPAHATKHNTNREKQIILLMIPNIEGREAKDNDNNNGIILQSKDYLHY